MFQLTHVAIFIKYTRNVMFNEKYINIYICMYKLIHTHTKTYIFISVINQLDASTCSEHVLGTCRGMK